MSRRCLVFVGAHPDDDTFGVARTVALHGDDPSFRFVLVLATDGGAGAVSPDVEVPPNGLGALRRLEDAESWRVLGRTPDRVEWLGLDDGGLADQSLEVLVERVAGILDEERPDVVATMGPDGITGHPDHITIGAATDRAFHTIRERGGGGLRRLVHAAIPQEDIDRWNRNRAAAGIPSWEADQPFHLRGVPDRQIAITVDARSVVPRTVAAIRAHRSQWSHLVVPTSDDELARSLREEDWVIAWPPNPEGAPVLGDLFADLDPPPESGATGPIGTGYATFPSSIGTCAVVWSRRGIVATHLPARDEEATRRGVLSHSPDATATDPPPGVQRAIDQIGALLDGEAAHLGDVELDYSGVDDFQRSVYEIARTVPAGSTVTYGEIAARLGDLSLARAVGQALGRNPFPLIVPCHRVVAAGGDLGGFSAYGGTITKRRLLAIEGEPILGAPTLFDLIEEAPT